MDIVVAPDAEGLLVDYFTAELPAQGDSATAHVNVPDPRPDRFVLVPRIGGTMRNRVVDQPTIGIECWAQTDAQAYGLAALVRGLVHALRGHKLGDVQCYLVDEFGGPSNLPDPVSSQSRYVLTVSIGLRANKI